MLAASTSRAQTQDLPRVGVLDLASETVPTAQARLLTDRLRTELFNTGRFLIMERERVEDILREQGLQQAGCVASECAIEVGHLIGVEQMVLGSVNRLGSIYTISLRLVNVQSAAVERVVIRDCQCSLEEVLGSVIEQAAIELGNVSFGRVQVVSSPAGATVNSTPRGISGTTPLALDKVPDRSYLVHISIPDYVTDEQTVEVRGGELTTVNATLQYAFGRVRILSAPPGATISSNAPAVAGTTPYANDRVEPGRYGIALTMAQRVPYEQTIEVQRNRTTTVAASLPLRPEVVRARNARIKVGVRWTSLACAVVSAGVAYRFERDAKSAYDDSDAAYARYRAATTTADAARWRGEAEDAAARGKSAARNRNVLCGIAVGAFSISVVVWVW